MEPVDRPATSPYARSWIDPVLDRIELLPGPAWAFYLGLWIAAIGIVSAVRWLDGSLPLATIDGFQAASTFYGPAALGLLHLLRRVAGSSLESFRPALDVSDDAYAGLHYQLTTIPAGAALVATAIGLVAAAAAVRLDSSIVTTGTSPAAAVTIVIVIYWAVVLTPILLYNTVRQLQLVARVHRMATRIDLFEARPLYAFSALSASAGVGLLLFNYYSALTDPTTFTNPIWYGVFGISVIVAIAFFVLPLYGMHQRIAAEKERLEAEANERLRTVISVLHRQIDRGDLGGAEPLNETFASLALEREILDKMPTWPWQPDAIRGFVTALVVPLVIWVVTRVLERVPIL